VAEVDGRAAIVAGEGEKRESVMPEVESTDRSTFL
jgi:hypothetical protein